MESKQRQVGRILWFQWVGASFLGSILSLLLSFILVEIALFFFDESSPVFDILGLWVLALPISFLQWRILRRYFPEKGWWIVATMIGVSFEFLSNRIIYMPQMPGIYLATAQWLVLRRHITTKHVRVMRPINKVGYWIAIRIFGWFIARPIITAIGGNLGTFVGWIIVGSITGFALVWMLEPSELDKVNGNAPQSLS